MIDETQASAATINLGSSRLSASNSNIDVNSNISLNGNIAINTTFDGTSGGGITVSGASSTIDIQSGSNLSIELNANYKPFTSSVSIPLFASPGGAQINAGAGITSTFVSINPNFWNPIAWSYNPDTFIITGVQGASPPIPGNISPNVANLASNLITAPANPTIIGIREQTGSTNDPGVAFGQLGAMEVNSAADQSNAEAIGIRNMALQERFMLIADYVGTDPTKFTESNEGMAAGSNYS